MSTLCAGEIVVVTFDENVIATAEITALGDSRHVGEVDVAAVRYGKIVVVNE